MGLETEMVGHARPPSPAWSARRAARQPGDVLRAARPRQQLVDHLVVDPPIGRHPESLPHSARPAARSTASSIEAPGAAPVVASPRRAVEVARRGAPSSRLTASRRRPPGPGRDLDQNFFSSVVEVGMRSSSLTPTQKAGHSAAGAPKLRAIRGKSLVELVGGSPCDCSVDVGGRDGEIGAWLGIGSSV